MRRRTLAIFASAVLAGVTAAPALGDPTLNDSNCAGFFTSAGASPALGPAVSGLAQSAPAAIPTTLDLANCGDNGQGL
jgi:hypothetical protein